MEISFKENKWEILGLGLLLALLFVFATLSIQSARKTMRDAVRLSDIRQIQIGLELYYNDTSVYPENSEEIPLGSISSSCLSRTGFKANCIAGQEEIYINIIRPTPQNGLKEQVSCGSVSNAYCFKGGEDDYSINFELETNIAGTGLVKGVNCAKPTGVFAGVCQ